MRSFTPFLKGIVTFAFLATAIGAVQAQSARKFGNKNPVVRLCPATCTAVNGHGFKAGASTTVYETKSGWARVSGYLDRAKLVTSFGTSTPPKPALWVPVSSLASPAKAKAPVKKKTVAKKKVVKKTPKRVSVIDRLARLRNPALPSFRPGTVVASAPVVETPAPAVAEVVETPAVETPIVEAPAVETPVVEAPVVETVEAPSTPVVVDTQGGDQKTLTWEQVQAKIAAQKRAEQSGVAAAAAPTAAATNEETDDAAKLAAAQKAADRKAALKAAALEREAKRAEAKKQADEARLKRNEELKKVAEAAKAQEVADANAAQEEARKLAEAKAKEAAEAKKAEAAKAAETAKAADASKADTKVGYTPPKEEPADGTVALGSSGQAVKLPPLASSETKVEPAKAEEAKSVDTEPVAKEEPVKVAAVEAPAKPEGPEPTFSSAEADPIDFGKRPKKLTKALLDKRLRKLPGRKSKVKPEVVIAMRHSALGLLKSGECKGIAGGGKSAVPGMFFITCTEDPGYLRQFPIVEESW